MNMLRPAINALVKEEDGQGMVEYALVIGVVSVALVATLGTFKDALIGTFNKTNSALPQ